MKTLEEKMTLGNLVFKKDYEGNDFPQLEITGHMEGKTHTYYLSPFRGYGFQVSGGPNGEGSFGRSEFLGLTNIVNDLSESVGKAVFYGMVLNAIHDHNRRYKENWYPNYDEQKKIDEFAEAAYKWVETLVQEPKQQTLFERMTQQFDERFSKKNKLKFKRNN